MTMGDNGANDVAEGDETAAAATRKVKVLLLGDRRVGKKSLVRRILGKPFDDAHCETLGVEVSGLETLAPGGSEVATLELWACSGAQRYVPIVQQNYRGARASLLVYDALRPESLERCLFWRNEVLRAIPDARIMLVRNKADAVGTETSASVSEEAHEKQADAWGIAHFRTSCKTGEGVEALVNSLMRIL